MNRSEPLNGLHRWLRCTVVVAVCTAGAGCSSSDEPAADDTGQTDTPSSPAPGTAACRASLECALYCDGESCADDCLAQAAPDDAPLVEQVLTCLESCPSGAARGPCLAETCFEAYHACYARGQSGEGTCARTWTCFGDCGDDPACIDECIATTSYEGLRQFVAVEVCSDTYVTTECAQPDCDAEALAGVCQPSFFACLDAGLPEVTEEMTDACSKAATCNWNDAPRAVDDCIVVVRRALAGCPTEDKMLLETAQTCLAQAACTDVGWKGCPGWKTSDICQEIVGTPEDGRWP